MVVIGAGVAGLAAAQRLVARGRDVVVLEARDRIGGRIWTLRAPELTSPVELGAEFLHAEAKETRAIARRAGLSVVDISGERRVSRQGRLRPAPDYEQRVARVMSKLRDDRVADRSFAAALSSLRSLNAEDRRLGMGFVQGFHAADPDRISEQSIADSLDDPEAMRIARVSGGYDRLVHALAATCRERVQLDRVVTRITWRRGEVSIEARSASGSEVPEVSAEKAIIALPLGVLLATAGAQGGVVFDPPVPAIETARRTLAMGSVVRLAVRFDEPFWTSARFVKRHGGKPLNELTFAQALAQVPFPVWWTTYPLEAPMLTGWTGGPEARKLAQQSPDSITQVAVRSLARIFAMSPATVSRHMVATFTHDWLHDPYSRGAYSYVTVGGAAAAAVLARSIERTLYFAGEHASSGRNGTVDGAIASGFRAAQEALRGSVSSASL